MPDITVTITDEEVTVLESYYETAEDGILASSRGAIKRGASGIIRESTSQLDPSKLSNSEIRTEIARLDAADEIPTYVERNPVP